MVEDVKEDEIKPSKVGNLGEPIKIVDLRIDGISAKSAGPGDIVQVWTRLSLTSDERLFHRAVAGLANLIREKTRAAGQPVDLGRVGYAILVIHADDQADLWADTAAIVMKVLIKRNIEGGTPVFENDIADIFEVTFPAVPILATDKIVVVFREGWRFGLYCDFNPDKSLSLEETQREIGTLFRRIKYSDLYDVIANEAVFRPLISDGWFPFAEILGTEFGRLADFQTDAVALHTIEEEIFAAFDETRRERMFQRWIAKPHFALHQDVLRSAMSAYTAENWIGVIKTALTEIEGILREAYVRVHGRSAGTKELLSFAVQSAMDKSGLPDTLLFPAAFAEYLSDQTFAKFDPIAGTGNASSRHAVGHGAASGNSYTKIRALQTLLTLDQLAFYT